jgi:hypothetical protein
MVRLKCNENSGLNTECVVMTRQHYRSTVTLLLTHSSSVDMDPRDQGPAYTKSSDAAFWHQEESKGLDAE